MIILRRTAIISGQYKYMQKILARKKSFDSLDKDMRDQIMFELCTIGELDAYYSDLALIEEAAMAWIIENGEPKTGDEWRAAVLARDSYEINKRIVEG